MANRWVSLPLEDTQGEIELVLFPQAWEKSSRIIKEDEVLLVDGKVDNEGSTPKILVDQLVVLTLDNMTMNAEKPQVHQLRVKSRSKLMLLQLDKSYYRLRPIFPKIDG